MGPASIIISVLLVVIFLAIGVIIALSGRKLGSVAPPESHKPDWVRAAAEQSVASTPLPDGNPERIASPAAEAVEALLQEALAAHPELSHYHVDLGSAPDGSLEVWVNGEKFDSIEALQDERLKQLFREVVVKFNQ
ncbi:MAG: hypothetical protein WHV44_01150 [Anaerolineales bacterium]